MSKNYYKSSILLLLFCLPVIGYSQGEANNWYFGQNAGITFNTTPPSVLLDGQLNTLEGCSSISSPNGDLLFYTDGRTIWTANHQIMPNADYFGGSGLNGDPSSTSSGLIVPHPTEENLFFVFTVDEPHHENANAFPDQGPADINGNPIPFYTDSPNTPIPNSDDGFNNGFAYTLVDMDLNGGLGDVVTTEKNIELITYDPNNTEDIKYKCSEKITAVRAQNCLDIWVITHFKDTFYAFRIDENGVNQNPVVSQVGPLMSTDDYRRAAIGYLKASPNGDKLLTANQTQDFDQATQSDLGTGNVFLFDFDNETGTVTNPLELISNVNAYSVEFSAEGTKAYASVADGGVPQLFQWDLQAGDIVGSQFQFSGVTGQGSGAIQLAPNGKIYRTILGDSRLSVINNPELPGNQADYTELLTNGAISLGGRTANFGLPPFIQSLFSTKIDITGQGATVTNLDLCDGDTFTLFYENEANAEYTWFRNDIEIANENASTLPIQQPDNISLPFSELYRLEVNFDDGSCPLVGVANVTYFELPEINNVSLEECVTDFEQNSAIFNLNEANAQFIGDSNNQDNFSFTYFESLEDAENFENPVQNTESYTNLSSPQTLSVVVRNESTGCENIMSLDLEIIAVSVQNFGLSLCDDNQNGIVEFDLTAIEDQDNISVSNFYLTENDALSQENPIQNVTSFQNENPYIQDVFFNIDSDEACKELGILTLEVVELPSTNNGIAYYCVEDFPNPITISADIPDDEIDDFEYFWTLSEETTPEILINSTGSYEVAITRIETGCTNFRTVEVLESGLASYDLEIEEFFEENNRVTVNVSEDSIGDYEFSLDPNGPYQDSNVFENLLPGIYDMFVRDKNGCGIVQKTFGILGIMDFFTPNGDGINDVWRFNGQFNNKEALAQVFIFDRYGKLIKSFRGLDKSWDGFFNGQPAPQQDYWYRIQLESGRLLVGNFTLKR
jgi:gliding motility-associated-like protein